MQISELLSEEKLAEHVEAGTVSVRELEGSTLAIANYTPRCQFSDAWDSVSEQCRGLIFDTASKEVIARPFRKFFNYNTAKRPETQAENLPTGAPIITRKYDGSLGIGYWFEGQWRVATRGSFTSDQARWATAWLSHPSRQNWPKGHTPLWEIIFNSNQIVVKYPFEGLVLLGIVDTETGVEMTPIHLQLWAQANNMRCVERIEKTLDACVAENIENEEGYVLSWPMGECPSLKIKIKFSDYCRLHKLLTQTSAVGVWEMLRDGQDIEELTVDVPADFATWIRGIETKLRGEFQTIENAALVAMLEYEGEKNITNPAEKKEFALYALTKGPLTPILFAMLAGKPYAPIIWKSLRPDGREARVFKVDEEG